jgi:hypothetical protein
MQAAGPLGKAKTAPVASSIQRFLTSRVGFSFPANMQMQAGDKVGLSSCALEMCTHIPSIVTPTLHTHDRTHIPRAQRNTRPA